MEEVEARIAALDFAGLMVLRSRLDELIVEKRDGEIARLKREAELVGVKIRGGSKGKRWARILGFGRKKKSNGAAAVEPAEAVA